MRSRKFLALIFSLLAIAPALAGYMTLLGAGVGSIAPVASWVSTTDPTFPSSSLTFSRTSLATMFDSTGKLTYAPNNLLTYSNTFSNAAWAMPSATITTGVLDRNGGTSASTLTATGAFASLYAFATTSSSHNVIQSIWIRRRTGTGKIWMKVASSGALFEITGQVTSSWTQVSISGAANASSTPNFLQLDTSGDAVDISEAGVSAVTYETTPRAQDQVITTSAAYYGPRIDYDPNTLAAKGLLIEEARTNIAVQSNTFSNASWTKDGASVTQNVSGIDGVANSAWTLTALAGASNHWFYQTIASSGVSAQIVAKAGTASWLAVGFGGGALVDGVYFNLSNGTKGASAGGGITSNITPLGNGYYLCQVYKPGVSNHVSYEIHTADAQALSWTAAGTETIIVQNAQLEVGSFATSYIPTAASSITRAADVVQFTGAALTALQGSAGSVIIQSISEASSSPAAITNVIKGTNSILYRDTTGKVGTTNGTTALLTAAAPTWSSAIRNGLAWSASGRSLGYTSGSIATDANTVSNGGTLYLGSSAGSAVESGWYQSFGLWNQRLPDATLSTKLTVGGSYAANDNVNPFAPKFAANDNLPVHWRIAL